MAFLDSTAVVTGAKGGIGMAVVDRLASHGMSVWACARKESSSFELHLEQLSQEHGVEVKPLYFDLSDKAAMKIAVKKIFAAESYPDVLVNNAGIAHAALFAMTPVDQIRSVFESNLFGHMELTQLLLHGMMRNKKGAIVNVASIAALEPAAGNCAYGVSKAAMVSWTRVLATEVAQMGIRVNAVAPTLAETTMGDSLGEDVRARHLKACALNKLVDPREIAAAIAFLVSEDSSFINGAIIRVDGGWKAY